MQRSGLSEIIPWICTWLFRVSALFFHILSPLRGARLGGLQRPGCLLVLILHPLPSLSGAGGGSSGWWGYAGVKYSRTLEVTRHRREEAYLLTLRLCCFCSVLKSCIFFLLIFLLAFFTSAFWLLTLHCAVFIHPLNSQLPQFNNWLYNLMALCPFLIILCFLSDSRTVSLPQSI